MPIVKESIDIRIDPAELYSIIEDNEMWADVMDNLRRVISLERGENYALYEWHAVIAGVRLTWRTMQHFKPSEYSVDFDFVDGDYFKKWDGYVGIQARGMISTLTVYIDYEAGVFSKLPMFDTLFSRIQRENLRQLLTYMKNIGEGRI